MNVRIKIFIVSYNDYDSLNSNLESLFSLDFSNCDVSVHVINNHTNFKINEKYADRVRVLHNQTRPNFSRGHLSRNWNQALINGFHDLNKPDCDIVIGCQDDIVWNSGAFQKLLSIHDKYSFYTCAPGDGLWSIKPEAVKKIGMWDERFCAITYQEADYFIRAVKYNKEFSSINDNHHRRVHNPTEHIAKKVIGIRKHSTESQYVWKYTLTLFQKKWPGISPESWTDLSAIPDCKIENFVYYPYFEKDIELRGKNYSEFSLN